MRTVSFWLTKQSLSVVGDVATMKLQSLNISYDGYTCDNVWKESLSPNHPPSFASSVAGLLHSFEKNIFDSL